MNDTPNYKTTSVFRFLNTRDKFLLGKTLKYFDFQQQALKSNIYTYRINCLERKNARVLVQTANGEKKWVIDCASNDYLQMNQIPEVRNAAIEAIREYGVGAQGASMLNGNTPVHFALEQALAKFLRKEATILSSSGYTSQLAATQGLLRPTDVCFYDQYSHSSLVDGMRLSGATLYKYPHLDISALKKLIQDYRDKFMGAMIVTDGVFSAEGTIAPVPELVQLAREYNAVLLVDDAHGFGTINDGKGCSVYDGVDIITGTLSKALGSAGGFICGAQSTIEYLRFFGSANCSTTNLSVANAASSLQALKIIERNPAIVTRLQENVRYLRKKLSDNGIKTADTPCPIVVLICGKDAAAYEAWRDVFNAGVLVHALPFPIVPHGKSRLRIRLHTGLEVSDLDFVGDAIIKVSKTLHAGTAPKLTASTYVNPLTDMGFQPIFMDTGFGKIVVHKKGEGKPIVFLHPLLFGSEIYSKVFGDSRVNAKNMLIAIDWWGHGKSPVTDKAITLEDMSCLLEEIFQQLGIGSTPVSLVGTSMGGMVALRFAACHPARVKHLLLVGTSADEEEEPSKAIFHSLAEVANSLGGQTIVDDIFVTMVSSHFMNESPPTVQAYKEYLLRRPVSDYLPCVNAVLNRNSITEAVPKIRARATILVGDEDIAESEAHSASLSEKIAGSKIKIIPCCGHLVPIERPDEIVSVIESWS